MPSRVFFAILFILTSSFLQGAASLPSGQSLYDQFHRIGVGKETDIRIDLKDGAHVRGYISELNQDSIVVMDRGRSVSYMVEFGDIGKAEAYNLNSGEKVVVGVIVAAGVVLLVWFLLIASVNWQ